MSWQVANVVATVLLAVAGMANYWVLQAIRLEVTKLRVDIERGRREDADQLKEWAEDRFELKTAP